MFNNGSKVSATIICEKGVGKPTQACLILTTSVSNVDDSCFCIRLVSLHQCRPTLESASNYIIIIILDGFISDCMRIYCTSHDDIHLAVPAR